MNSPIQIIVTPQSNTEVEIKEWITGAEAEYIDQALMAGVDVKADMASRSASFGKFNTAVIDEQTHREIEKFVVRVAGDPDKVLEKVLGLPEEDCQFVKDHIKARRLKKKAPDGQKPQSQT